MQTMNHKRFRPMTLLALALTLTWGTAAAEAAEYQIDPEHAVVAFLVDHIGFARVLGSFGRVEGSFSFDESTGSLSDVRVTVATASVSSLHEERDEHLRSDDFLDSREYPQMIFTADTARRLGEREFEIVGELTLLGISRPLTLEATWNKSGDYPIGRNAYAIGVSAKGVLRRSDFGMDYAIDNGWVGDEVEIIIEIEAQRR